MVSPMQYVRMLTNSLIAGALVGAYAALLVLQLNPRVQLDSTAVVGLDSDVVAVLQRACRSIFLRPDRSSTNDRR